MAVIDPISAAKQVSTLQKPQKSNKSNVDFAGTIKEFLYAVNNKQTDAAKASADIVQGNSENLAEAMTKSNEAQLSFELMLEVRNKLLESFKEIQRMQV